MTHRELKLEELQVGMTVPTTCLNSIVGVPITIKASTIDYSDPFLRGQIVSIGEEGIENIDDADCMYIYNSRDMSDFDGEMGDL